jgi:hypothetical protein
MIYTDYIVSILEKLEGKLSRGYVPCRSGVPLGASGVTIGTGIDLGQQSDASLSGWNLPDKLAGKLRPYLGLKKMDAVAYLKNHPLTLSEEEVSTLDRAVHKKYIQETAVLFGEDRFEEAPKQAQAVAVSLHYQFGTPVRAASPGLRLAWNAIRDKRYQEAAAYLTSPRGWSGDHQQYMARRKQEAAFLKEIA